MSVFSQLNAQQTSYIEMLENFRKCRNEWTQLYPAMDQLPVLFPQLLTSNKCICVGAGLAQYDTEFINRCLPKVKSLQVIEADPTCLDFLRKNLASMLCKGRKDEFPNKYVSSTEAFPKEELTNVHPDEPLKTTIDKINDNKIESKDETKYEDMNVQENIGSEISNHPLKIDIYEGLVQDWSNTLDENTYVKADVLIAFHLFYYLSSEERKKFYADCFHRWLKPGGLAFFVLISDRDRTNLIQNIYRELNLSTYVEIAEIKKEIRGLCLDVAHEQPYSCVMDLSNSESSCLEFIQAHACEFRSQREILDAIEKVSDGGKGTYMAELIAVREKRKKYRLRLGGETTAVR